MRILVAGGGGFIGGHLVKALVADGNEVRSVDVKPIDQWWQPHPRCENWADTDLMDADACRRATKGVDAVFNLAADMGGMGFIENNKAACMLSVLISTHLLQAAVDNDVERLFYASSACVYAAEHQTDPNVTALKEADAYPAMPEDGYGWEKLFSERMARHFREDYGIQTRVARYHNVYGPNGSWTGGREKAPAALSRKVAECVVSGRHEIEVWGDGEQTRSFMFVDDCVRGTRMLMDSDVTEPINIGSSELVSINGLIDIISDIAGITVERRHDLTAPQGVRGRNSDNTMILEQLGWEPSTSLRSGLEVTYAWVLDQVRVGCRRGSLTPPVSERPGPRPRRQSAVPRLGSRTVPPEPDRLAEERGVELTLATARNCEFASRVGGHGASDSSISSYRKSDGLTVPGTTRRPGRRIARAYAARGSAATVGEWLASPAGTTCSSPSRWRPSLGGHRRQDQACPGGARPRRPRSTRSRPARPARFVLESRT